MKLRGLAAALALTGCASSGGRSDPISFSEQLNPRASYVRERLTISQPANASIRELALSVPTYVGAGGDGKTNSQGDSWVFLGDGAQWPVMAKVLTEPGVDPVRMKLIRGASPPEDPQVATVYEMEKVTGGWKILSVQKGLSSALLVWPME